MASGRSFMVEDGRASVAGGADVDLERPRPTEISTEVLWCDAFRRGQAVMPSHCRLVRRVSCHAAVCASNACGLMGGAIHRGKRAKRVCSEQASYKNPLGYR